VKRSRLNKMIAGVVIILTGIGLFLDSLHIISFGLFDLWPMILVYFGVRWWNGGKRIRGGVLSVLGILIALEMWLGIDVGDLFGMMLPLALIYVGLRLIRRYPSRAEGYTPPAERTVPPPVHHADAGTPARTGEAVPDQREAGTGQASPLHTAGILLPKDFRSSLIGDFHLTSGRFELSHLHIWHGVGNVVIDLSRAILMQQESLLVVDGWVGDVTVYVPVDMPVAITADVKLGDAEVFGHRQGGLNRYMVIRSEHYERAAQKVNLNISLIVGDIDVKYI